MIHHPQLERQCLGIIVPDSVNQSSDGHDDLAAVLPEGDDIIGAHHREEGRLDVRMRAEEAV